MPPRLSILCALCVFAAIPARAQPIPDTIDFNRDIRPILSENCFFCHGPDAAHRKADLRLDTAAGFTTPLGDAKRLPIVPNNPDASELYKRLITDDDADRMPDPKSGKHLSPREIALIKKWIEQGAPYKGHWSYEKPVKSPVPKIKDEGGRMKDEQKPSGSSFILPPSSFTAVDAFLLAKLADHKLSFSKEADRTTLIRRLSFDLTGLPPTPEQVAAFVNDTSPTAYESLVDRLLASPHFGERMALHWLDLVRFADTAGYHSDNPKDVTPYRDYVIDAYNANVPFDLFTRDQLAGDLLPNPTLKQKVASAYNRLLQTTEEGGAQPKEYAAKYLADRVRNVSSVWLAGTMGCCECHDHKFDPYTAKDFYAMAAFFADVKEAPVGNRGPGMPVPTQGQEMGLAKFDASINAMREQLAKPTPELTAAQAEWESSIANVKPITWTVLTPDTLKSANGATLKLEKDNAVTATGKSPETDTYTLTFKTKLKNVTGLKLEALIEPAVGKRPKLPAPGPGRASNHNFVLTEIELAAAGQPILFSSASASYEQTGAVVNNPYNRWPALAAIDRDAKGPAWGWAILEQAGRDHVALFETATDLPPRDPNSDVTLTITLKQNHGQKHTLGRFRISATDAPRPIRLDADLPKDISAIAAVPPAKRTPAQRDKLAAHFRSVTPLLTAERAALGNVEKQRADYVASFRRVLVTTAQPPATVKILKRGNWQDDTGQPVTPAVPHFLPQIGNGQSAIGNPPARATRLDLANWLTSRDNPLTARVVVNRYWKLFFGTGLSKSLEDLGSQGEWPTHPELLDFLAVDFMDFGWDTKRLIRQLVTSQAYRQSSYASKDLREFDPFNRLLARQSRWRHDAEFVRDNALAVAGLLHAPTVGGDSVRPYQPDGYWDFLNFPRRTYQADKDAAQYRRGLYVWVQRAFPHTSLTNFDAPSREECTAERTRSNTPQQALTLLNDPTYVEAARALATRATTNPNDSPTTRIIRAFTLALQRQPRPAELTPLLALYDKHRAQYAADPRSADALLSVGLQPPPKDLPTPDLAALTNVCRVVLNLHETVTRN